MPPDPPTMGRTYKSYEAPGTRPPPPIFHEVSATVCNLAFADLLQFVQATCSKPEDNKFVVDSNTVDNLQQTFRQKLLQAT